MPLRKRKGMRKCAAAVAAERETLLLANGQPFINDASLSEPSSSSANEGDSEDELMRLRTVGKQLRARAAAAAVPVPAPAPRQQRQLRSRP
jgi:hypothetical protein